MPVNQRPQQVLLLTSVHASRSILYSVAKRRSGGSAMQARTLRRSQLLCLSPMEEGASLNGQRTMDEMMGAAKPIIEEVKVKEEEQVMEVVDLTEPAASSELVLQMVQALIKVRKAKYYICSFYNIDFRELVNEHELTHEEFLFDSVDLVLRDPKMFEVFSGTSILITICELLRAWRM